MINGKGNKVILLIAYNIVNQLLTFSSDSQGNLCMKVVINGSDTGATNTMDHVIRETNMLSLNILVELTLIHYMKLLFLI